MSRIGTDVVRRQVLRRLLRLSAGATAAGLMPLRALAAGAGALVKQVRAEHGGDGTEVVFELTGEPQLNLFQLEHPARVVIDLKRAAMASSVRLSAAHDSVVKGIRYAPRHHSDLRVVLDLQGDAEARSFVYKPDAAHPDYRLVVKLAPAGAAPGPKKAVGKGRLRDVVVVIDPGHGGKDPGAVGAHGTYEKTVVLAMARRLRDLLAGERGIQVHLTRDRDVFLPLRRRVFIAREHKADLFVSVHADASTDRRVRGSSVYILSRHGASSEMARRLADRENLADLVGGVDLSNKDPVLASVLLDLAQTGTLQASTDLATSMLHSLDDAENLFRHRVERAGFVVLKSPDIPSALVETAFISNPGEERKLRTASFQEKIAHALHDGVHAYFKEHAPPDSVLAALNRRGAAG